MRIFRDMCLLRFGWLLWYGQDHGCIPQCGRNPPPPGGMRPGRPWRITPLFPSFELFRILLLDRLGGLLHETHDVAHTENAAGDAVGLERLQGVELLAHAHELDRPARDRPHGERSAASRVAVDPRQYDPRDAHPLG